MNIAIRVDSSIDIGSGHVMRCLTLAEQFRECGNQVEFICRKAKGSMEMIIEHQHFDVISLPEIDTDILTWMENNYEVDANETLNILSTRNIDLLVIDHYGIDSKWENKFNNYKLMVIDDLANRSHTCDFILDQNFYKNAEKRYEKYISNKTITCFGPKYMLIRKEFHLNYEKRSNKTIFVFFGSMDQKNETLKTLKALKRLQRKYYFGIIVVVGQSNPHKEEIESYSKRLRDCEFYCQVTNMAELMGECHFSITAGGTITWERSVMDLPGIIIVVAENQVELTENLVEINASGFLGESEYVTEESIAHAIESILENPKILEQWLLNMNKIVNKKDILNQPILEKIKEGMNLC